MDRGAIAAGALAAAAASIALAAATLPCRAAPPASSDDGHEKERLRQLRLGQLRTRAKAAGVDEKTVAGALDADDPKSALVALVLERSAATAGGTTTHGLRSELDAMRPGELHLRALADGATDQDVADALDHPDGPHRWCDGTTIPHLRDAGGEDSLPGYTMAGRSGYCRRRVVPVPIYTIDAP